MEKAHPNKKKVLIAYFDAQEDLNLKIVMARKKKNL